MESKQCSSEKKNRKRGTTEPDHQSRPREPEPPLLSRGLVRCSSFSSEKEEEKSKYEEYDYSVKSLITTITKTTIDTTSITIITPPEDPNYHIHLYLCIRTDIKAFSWFKIDPTNKPVNAPKPKSSSKDNTSTSTSNHNSRRNLKSKKQQPPILVNPIFHMPPNMPYGFRVIPPSSFSGKQNQQKKLVYAVGAYIHGPDLASKAFVCDFASPFTTTTTNPPPCWEELPPMPSPIEICIGVASPLDANVYAFGYRIPTAPGDDHHDYMGVVFNPSSTSWKQCPPPFGGRWHSIDDYALIRTENQSKLCVFTSSTGCHPFNLTTTQWEGTLRVPVPTHPFKPETSSTSVGVGHLIFKFHNRKLYALDSSSLQPSFERVPGLDKHKLPNYWEVCGSGRMVYLGKGKLCIVWGRHSIDPHEDHTIYITCLMFWIGMCNRRNRLRAVIDRYERFVAHGCQLYEVIAL
ncbi:hypothetical protein LguiA_020288 [Lonicera macranthoides]